MPNFLLAAFTPPLMYVSVALQGLCYFFVNAPDIVQKIGSGDCKCWREVMNGGARAFPQLMSNLVSPVPTCSSQWE
jgi:hypothetical protein